jgi:hypothetical protein
VDWWVNLSASPSPFSELSVVIRCLRGAVGGWGGRGFLSGVLALLLFRRLGEICGQIERLAARFQAGRLWCRVPGRVVAQRCGSGGGSRAGLARIWPARFGWLLRAAAHHAAVYNGQLRVILERPEMVELLVAAPQAARILRPVCRMLAVETSLLRPEVAAVEVVVPDITPETQAPGAVVKVRVRRPRVAVDWGRIPLPRGVLAAARRQGFGKVPLT